MIEWIDRDNRMIKGKEYLLTDGKRIMTGSFNTPYGDEDTKIWFSDVSMSYINGFEFTHYAEINYP